jgi:hypothetical protein
MQPANQRIPVEKVQAAGGDWAGYGEITGPQLINLLQQDKIRLEFASTHLLVSIQRPDGLVGTYSFRHEELVAQAQPAQPVSPSGELTSELDKLWTLADLLPLFNQYGNGYGFDPKVLAAIAYQESGFRNWRVHQDGTGFGLFGLDDNGLLPDFERWSGLTVGRGDQHRPVTPNQQIQFAAMQLRRYQDALGGDAILAAQAWHRGMGAYQDQRGIDYGNTIRAHVTRLFG